MKALTEEEILLVLNYDSNGKESLTLTERCKLHRIANDLRELRPLVVSPSLKAKIAMLLTEIAHRKYKYVKVHFSIEQETGRLISVKRYV